MVRILYALVLVAVLTFSTDALLGRKQKLKIKGKLLCPSEPSKAGNVQVKLVDKDVGVDDTMDEERTDSSGRFTVEGEEEELGDIDPELKIYHNCNDKGVPCERRWLFKIPHKYINHGEMDIGDLNLELIMDDEERNCI